MNRLTKAHNLEIFRDKKSVEGVEGFEPLIGFYLFSRIVCLVIHWGFPLVFLVFYYVNAVHHRVFWSCMAFKIASLINSR